MIQASVSKIEDSYSKALRGATGIRPKKRGTPL